MIPEAAVEAAAHNHMTRDIKEHGKCSACDEYLTSKEPAK